MANPLRSLAEIIASAVTTLETQFSSQGLDFPSLDDPYEPNKLDNGIEVVNARRMIVAAAAQLIATVSMPTDLMKECSTAMFTTATLGFAVDTDIADFLDMAGPKVSIIFANMKFGSLYIQTGASYRPTR